MSANATLPERLEPDPVIEAYKRDLDMTLIRHALSLSVPERLERLVRLNALVAEMHQAGREVRARASP
ncbi:MAG: hypothetical protein ACRDHF_02545 [Tepidiformaceae bacterium]